MNNFNIIEQYNNNNPYQMKITRDDSGLSSNYIKPKTGLVVFNDNTNSNKPPTPTSLIANNNNANRANNFKEMLNENQKTIQEISKEALKEFQSLVTNELKPPAQTQSANPANQRRQFEPVIINPQSHFNNHHNFISHEQSSNQKQYETMNTTQNTTLHAVHKQTAHEQHAENNLDNMGIVESVDDVISSDDTDSMDTDSLLNAKIDSPEPVLKPTANKKNDENDDDNMNSNSNFNLVKRYNTQNLAISNHPRETSYTTNQASTQGLNNANKMQEYLNNFDDEDDFELMKENEFNFNSALPLSNDNNNNNNAKGKNKQIKSILKRSASLDNNLTIVGFTNNNNLNHAHSQTTVNFGIKTDKHGVKDSIELANNRIGGAKKDLNDSKKEIQKKSVRFAAQLSESDSGSASNNVFIQHQVNNQHQNKPLEHQQTNVNTEQPANATNGSSCKFLFEYKLYCYIKKKEY